ncbi:MAG: glutamate mutase L [Bacillota bacterium]
MSEVSKILGVDVGSTTSKALLFGRGPDGYFTLIGRGEAETTVEAPFEDVMVGVIRAIQCLEEVTGRVLLEGGSLVTPATGERGVDLMAATSSAGGGLQMVVAGLVRSMTAESAERAALGAGAIVMDVIALDDARLVAEKIDRLRKIRPDIFLLTGGTDHGNLSGVVSLAEYLQAANPRPRWGQCRLPVVYAGNCDAVGVTRDTLAETMDLHVVDNLRPTLPKENLGPAREKIHQLFLEHVMAQAPGYQSLLDWTDQRIQPTPMAVGKMMEGIARRQKANILGVDIGGATTDIFTVFFGQYHRSVSANLGMSYSLGNVLVEAGVEGIARWLPFPAEAAEIRDWAYSKMLFPTSLPDTIADLILEQAAAREAIRLALEYHSSLAREMKGVQITRSIDELLTQRPSGQTVVQRSQLDVIIGSGGVLSHAPSRRQAALILVDAIEPVGISRLYVDSIFMLPQLGALSEIDFEAAERILFQDCLIPLGTVIAAQGKGIPGQVIAAGKLEIDGQHHECQLVAEEMAVLPLPAGTTGRVELIPRRGIDLGNGPGRPLHGSVMGGEVGLVLDGRLRNLGREVCPAQRAALYRQLELYPGLPESVSDLSCEEVG